jgi:hypothetical protein
MPRHIFFECDNAFNVVEVHLAIFWENKAENILAYEKNKDCSTFKARFQKKWPKRKIKRPPVTGQQVQKEFITCLTL